MAFLLFVAGAEGSSGEMFTASFAEKAKKLNSVAFAAKRSVGNDEFPGFGRSVCAMAVRARNRHSGKGVEQAPCQQQL